MKNGFDKFHKREIKYTMQFAFEFRINGEMKRTYYTKENQSLLAHSLNNGIGAIKVFHETQKGRNAGKIVMHEINFIDMTVKNTDSGWFHKLMLIVSDPEPKKESPPELPPSPPPTPPDEPPPPPPELRPAAKICFRDCKYCTEMDALLTKSLECEECEWRTKEKRYKYSEICRYHDFDKCPETCWYYTPPLPPKCSCCGRA